MTDETRAVLKLAAANAVIVPAHAGRWLKAEEPAATETLDALVEEGLLKRDRLVAGAPACYRISRAGLDAVGSDLPVPVLDSGRLRHDVAATFLWLAAHDGAFGSAERVISRRELAALGEPADADVVVVLPAGWVPLLLAFSLPSKSWLERVLRGYGRDPRVAAWMFLAEDLEPARGLIGSVAAELGLAEMNRVQGLNFS